MESIKINKLTKKYGNLTAVDSLELSINEGELFALLGVNGSGKTTTINMLTGLTMPTSGSAEICSYDLVFDNLKVKSLTGVSPQETAVAQNLTVKENLVMIAEIYGIEKPEKVADDIISSFGLDEKKNIRASKLSGGQKRRLSIAMALISNPKIVYLDEPTLGLDIIARRELWKIIENLHGKTTVILTTHYLEEAEKLADRIGVLKKGKLVALGTADEIVAKSGEKTFEDAFVALAGEAEE